MQIKFSKTFDEFLDKILVIQFNSLLMKSYQKIIGRFYETPETQFYQRFEALKGKYPLPVEEYKKIEEQMIFRSTKLRKHKENSVFYFMAGDFYFQVNNSSLPEVEKTQFIKEFDAIFTKVDSIKSILKDEMLSFRINSQTKVKLNKAAQSYRTSTGDFIMGFFQLGHRLYLALKTELQTQGITDVDTFGVLKNYESIAPYLADVILQQLKAQGREMKEE